MARADFGLSRIFEEVPQLDIGGLLPSTPITPPERRQPLIINAPRAQTALTKKYSTFMRVLATEYEPALIQSMMDFDAQRVRNGQSPLGEEETRAALEAARTDAQVTQEPKRSIGGPAAWAGNAIKDIGDIVKAIPRLPGALYHEAQDVYKIGTAMQEGPNPLAGLLRAPGIRLIPGTYTAGNILAGEPGEILRHPIQTVLDVLPAAATLAKTSPVMRAVADVVEPARRAPEGTTLSTRDFRKLDRAMERPVSTTLFNKVGEDGLPIRNPAGEFIDVVKSSKIGKFLTQHFGLESQDVAFALNSATAKVNAMLEGKLQPTNELEAITKVAHDFRADLIALDPELVMPGNISRIYNAMIDDNYAGLTDTELAATQIYRTKVLEPLTDWALRTGKNIEFGGEVYDNVTGALLLESQKALDEVTTLNRVRDSVLGGSYNDALQVLVDRLNSPGKLPGRRGRLTPEERIRSIRSGEVGAKELLLAWRGTRQALRNAGYDTALLDAITAKGKKAGPGLTSKEFATAIKGVQDGTVELPLAPSMTLNQVVEYAKSRMGEKSVAYRDLVLSIQRNEWKGVTYALDNLRRNITNPPEFVRGVENARDTARLMTNGKFKTATEDGVSSAQAALNRVKERNLPARFLPKQQQLTREITARKLKEEQEYLPVEDQATTERIIAARDAGELADIPGFTIEMYRQSQREAARTVMRLKEAGFDPVFIHTVTPNRIESSLRFGENVVPMTPASTKTRRADLAPSARDMTIAANDMAMQFLAQPLKEMQVQMIQDMFGYTLAEVNQLTHETARFRAGKSAVLDYEGHKAKVISEKFRALDPEDLGLNWGSPYINKLIQDKVYVPVNVYRHLKELAEPQKGILGGILDPTTKLFRISTTALSLRTQIYNAVGGPISATLLNPTALFKYSNEAIRMLRDPTVIPTEMQSVIGSNVRTMLELDNIAKGKVVEGVRKYMVGEKLRKAWDLKQASKTPGTDLAHRFGNRFSGIVEKSYELNGIVDDFTRMVTYLAEYDKGIAKGWTHEVAAYKAVGIARRVLQDYMGMTPFERNVVKSLIPFYGFIGHAMRFVMRFPLDHPLRAEFMAKLAEAELEDHNSGLPSRFLAMLFFGEPDAQGNQSALNLGPFNPFGDIANSMTLAGFLGNTNPVLQTMFEMVGLERGRSELYPSLRYDPETGRMEAQHPGFIQTAIGNIIPPSAGILALMGMNSEYNDMLNRDPEAAGRYLLSTLTIPIIERQYNVPQEQFAAELARRKSADSVLNKALKSGDWSEAMRYPSLVAYLNAVDAMPEDQLQEFVPKERQEIFDMARTAFDTGPSIPQVPTTQMSLDDLVAAQLATSIPYTTAPISGLAAGGALGLNGI